MYLRKSIIISEVDDGYVAIDGDVSKDRFNGMVKVNAQAKDILDILSEKDVSENELLERYAIKNNVEIEEIKDDVLDIVNKLKEIKYIVD